MIRGEGVRAVQGPIGTGAVAIEGAVMVGRRVDGRGRVVGKAHGKLPIERTAPLNALHLFAAPAHHAHTHCQSRVRWERERTSTDRSHTVPGPSGPGPHFSTHLPSLYRPGSPHWRQMRWP